MALWYFLCFLAWPVACHSLRRSKGCLIDNDWWKRAKYATYCTTVNRKNVFLTKESNLVDDSSDWTIDDYEIKSWITGWKHRRCATSVVVVVVVASYWNRLKRLDVLPSFHRGASTCVIRYVWVRVNNDPVVGWISHLAYRLNWCVHSL